ncbi:MAG: hypothetical protein AB7U73_00805 [Pirellulales bacterium]
MIDNRRTKPIGSLGLEADRIALGIRLFIAILMVFATAKAWGMEPPEVHEVEASPDEFLERPISLTGRFSAFSAGRMRLVDSGIDFRVLPVAGVVRHAMTHVELTGRLLRTSDGLAFDVTAISAIAPEARRFAERRASLHAPQFAALYELSRWARERGKWYGDEPLLELAWGSYREAFGWQEEETARIGDAEKLLALAARGESLGLEAAEATRIRHRALWLKAAMLPIAQPVARRQLAAEVRELLPGTEEPLTVDVEFPRTEYERQPVEMYANLGGEDRLRAHRALWSRLVGQAVEDEARQPGANLVALVDETRSILPDHPQLLQRLEKQYWTERTAQPERMTRSDLERARAAWIRLGEDARATELTTIWLGLQLERLTPGDAEARLRLARDYLELAGDRNAAILLAREAAQLSPELGEAAALLEQLDFALVDGQWQPIDELAGATSGDDASGFVQPGDSEAAVREKLRPPDRVTRVAGRGWIQEQWIYNGPARFSIFLRRTPATGLAVVVRVVGD